MTRKYCIRFNKEPKDELIDLTDMGNHNRTTVIRSKIDSDSPSNNDSPIEFIEEDKGQGYNRPPLPEDPEPEYEDRLVAEGAFIINSTTYFPASKTTVTRKSQTPAERAQLRTYLQKQ